MIAYLLQVSLCWGAFYGLYALLLRRETFFHFNRAYLLGTLLASLVIPVVEWHGWAAQTEIATVYLQPITVGMETLQVTVTATELSPQIGFLEILTWIYGAGVAFFAVRFLIGLRRIYQLYRRGEKQVYPDFTLVISANVPAPFSFLHCLFLSQSLELDPADRAQILLHERAHIRGRHSWDVLLLEVLNALFWCSPFIYCYRRSLRIVHEYIADAAVLRTTQRKQYGHLLIRQSQSGPVIALVHPFHSQLKKRILMMMQQPSKRQALLKYLLVLPLTLVVLLVFSNAEAKASLQQQAEEWQQAIQEKIDWDNVTVKVEGENFTKLEMVNGQVRFESKEGAIVKVDSIPIAGASNNDIVQFEIYHPDGNVEKFTGKANDIKLNEKVKPDDIASIDVSKENGQNLIKIWLKGAIKNKIENMLVDEAAIFSYCKDEQSKTAKIECSNAQMLQFLYANIKYPQEAQQRKIEGTVRVAFTIGTDGSVISKKIQKGIGGGCEEEVLRVLGTMPRWTPAKKDGKPVSYQIQLPIHFDLGGVFPKTKDSAIDTVTVFDPDTYEEGTYAIHIDKKEYAKIPSREPVFINVEQAPEFPGGINELLKFLGNNVKYPEAARKAGTEGKVVAQFVVGKDGTVREPKILRGVTPELDSEAVRVIRLLPKWKPGTQAGKVVDTYFTLPIQFKLGEESPPSAVPPANTLALEHFQAAPNPTSGILNLQFRADRQPTTVQVFDLQGKELQSLNLTNFDGDFNGQLNLSQASKGTVLLRVRQGERVFTEKIILQ
jgi:TonB family protein